MEFQSKVVTQEVTTLHYITMPTKRKAAAQPAAALAAEAAEKVRWVTWKVGP